MEAPPKTIPEPAVDPFVRLRTVSKIMVVAVTIGMVALVALVAVIFLVPAVTRATIGAEVMPFGIVDISERARVLGFLVLALPLTVFLFGLNEVRLLFGQYALGEVLTASAARRLKRIAWITIIGAILRAPTRIGLFLALTLDQADVQRALPVRISAADLTFLLFGLLLLAVAWVMAEAARIAEEHRQIV
jgi:hypothetical protein